MKKTMLGILVLLTLFTTACTEEEVQEELSVKEALTLLEPFTDTAVELINEAPIVPIHYNPGEYVKDDILEVEPVSPSQTALEGAGYILELHNVLKELDTSNVEEFSDHVYVKEVPNGLEGFFYKIGSFETVKYVEYKIYNIDEELKYEFYIERYNFTHDYTTYEEIKYHQNQYSSYKQFKPNGLYYEEYDASEETFLEYRINDNDNISYTYYDGLEKNELVRIYQDQKLVYESLKIGNHRLTLSEDEYHFLFDIKNVDGWDNIRRYTGEEYQWSSYRLYIGSMVRNEHFGLTSINGIIYLDIRVVEFSENFISLHSEYLESGITNEMYTNLRNQYNEELIEHLNFTGFKLKFNEDRQFYISTVLKESKHDYLISFYEIFNTEKQQ